MFVVFIWENLPDAVRIGCEPIETPILFSTTKNDWTEIRNDKIEILNSVIKMLSEDITKLDGAKEIIVEEFEKRGYQQIETINIQVSNNNINPEYSEELYEEVDGSHFYICPSCESKSVQQGKCGNCGDRHEDLA